MIYNSYTKKAVMAIVGVVALFGLGNAVSACETIDFDYNGTICVDLIKDGNTYSLDLDYSNLSLSHSNAYYYVLLPNKKTSSKTSGGGLLSNRLTDSYSDFSYNYKTYNGYDSETRMIKVYAIIGNEVRSTEVYYDFYNGERSDENGDNSSSSSSSNGNLDNFYMYLSDNTPAEDDTITLYLRARDSSNYVLNSYDGSNAQITVEYRTSSSSTRRTASSSYFSIDDSTPNFNNGIATTHITFKYSYEYRVTVADDSENIEDSQTFDVGGSSSSSSNNDASNFYVTNNNSNPSVNERIDLSIRVRDTYNSTVNDYTDDVKFSVYYRTSSSNARTKTTSSNYFDIASSYDDGYDFSSSDDGIVTLDNFIKFKQKRDFKVVVEDANDSTINGYMLFSLRNQTSTVNGFSVTELEAVTKIYNSRSRMISSLKSSYSKLRTNTTWLNMSDDFYSNMKDVINDASNKEFVDYSDYLSSFKDRYNYTVDHR